MNYQETLKDLGTYIAQSLARTDTVEKENSELHEKIRILESKINDLNKPQSEQLIAEGLGIVRALLRGDNVETRRKIFVERYPEFETNLPPRKMYYAEIMVQGNNHGELVSELRHVLHWVSRGDKWMLGGSVTLQTYIDPDMTPEKYRVALDKYLESETPNDIGLKGGE